MEDFRKIIEKETEKYDLTDLAEKKCFMALMQIKKILQDENLSDAACYAKIEKIIALFDSLGLYTGRHDC